MGFFLTLNLALYVGGTKASGATAPVNEKTSRLYFSINKVAGLSGRRKRRLLVLPGRFSVGCFALRC